MVGVEGVRAAEGACGLLVVADGKRGDIGSTSRAYSAAFLEPRNGSEPLADAMTRDFADVPPRSLTAEARAALRLPQNKLIVALLPGSRPNELHRLVPVLAAAVPRIQRIERGRLACAVGEHELLVRRAGGHGPTV